MTKEKEQMKKITEKPKFLKDIEGSYELLKSGYESKGCYFEIYGYRPAMEFVYGAMLFRTSLANTNTS